MRKKWIPGLLLMLFFCGCHSISSGPANPVETTLSAVTEPTGPEIVFASAKVDGVPAVLTTLSRDDMVNVVSSYDEKHYAVKTDLGYGLVEKNLLRVEEEGIYAPWTGYAYHGTKVYDNYRLAGKPVQVLQANDSVEVLNDLGWCYLVKLNGEYGYIPMDQLASRVAPGGKIPGGVPEPGNEDGGDIEARFHFGITQLAAAAPQSGEVSGLAMVLADGTDVILAYFDAGDQIPLLKDSVDAGGDVLLVYLEGIEAKVNREYVLLDGETQESPWRGYSACNTAVYDNFWLQGSPVDMLSGGLALNVLHELEHCYFVEIEGRSGYVAKNTVSVNKP